MNFDNLPDSWEITNLGIFFDKLQYGYTASASEKNDKIKLLRITDLQDRLVNWENVPGCEISDNDYKKYQLENGDFVFARTGSIEKAWMVKDVPNAVFASYLIRGKPLLSSVSPWLNKFIETLDYLIQIRDLSAGIGRSNVNAQNLSKVIVPLAPLNEQKRIVEKIELIQERTRKVKSELENIKVKLKRFRRSLLASAFRGDLTKDWRADHPDIESATVLLERIKQNSTQKKQKSDNRNLPDPFKILENWQWVTLFDICISITDGDHQAPPKTTEGIPFLVISNINKGSLDFSNTRYVPEDYYQKIQEHRKPQQGDIIYSVVGSYGIPVLIETERKFCFQRHIALLKIHPLVNNRYLLYALKSDFVYNQVTDAATGTAQLTVSLTELRKIKIPLAPLEEQKEIVRKLEKMMQFADRVEERVKEAETKLEKFNQSVLAKAFRGKLVPQDPNDEPASVLLEKIQQEKNSTTSKKIKK